MRNILSTLALLSIAALCPAQDATTQPDPFDAAVQRAFVENTERYMGNADVFVRSGLVADRHAQTMTITARFTGVNAGDAVEFFLVGPESGKEYESLAVSAAKPSDVQAALEFLGMKPGRPVNYRENHNWPKGERVDALFSWDARPAVAGEKGAPTQLHAEEMLTDARTEKTLPAEGFLFVGSNKLPPREEGGEPLYAADVSEGRSILSNYNEPSTVLDLPSQAVQGAVYGFRKISPSVKFVANQAVTVTLKPRPLADGSARVKDLFLYVEPNPAADKSGPMTVVSDKPFTGDSDTKTSTAAGVLKSIASYAERGHDVFVTITPDDRLSLADVRTYYALLNAAQGEKGLRIDAAPAGHLFWRAFFPQEDWRDPKTRLGEPWELHVRADEKTGQTHALLRQFSYDADQNLKTRDFAVKDADDLAKILKTESGRWTDGVFVFAPDELTYGQLMTFIRPGLANVTWWYVFSTKPAATQPAQIP